MGALLGDFEEVSQEKSAYQILPLQKVERERIICLVCQSIGGV